MADNVSKEKRSETMRRIKSKDSRIETKLRKALWQAGFRYRKNAKNHFGKPDLVLKKSKAVVFIDSCYWHGCRKHCRIPSTRKKYWVEKIARNKKRDKEVGRYYKNKGWKIIRVWEHDLTKEKFDQIIEKTKKLLK